MRNMSFCGLLLATFSIFASSAEEVQAQAPVPVDKEATVTTLTSLVNPVELGDEVTLELEVSAVNPTTETPTGTVTVYRGDFVWHIIDNYPGGKATFRYNASSVGTEVFRGVYDGNDSFEGSQSDALSQVVTKRATATTLTSDINPSVVGQQVTLSVSVAPVAPSTNTPTGTVTVLSDDGPFLVVPYSGDTITATFPLDAAGTVIYRALYSGNDSFAASTAPDLSQTVKAGRTTVGLTVSSTDAVPGETIKVVATVAAVSPASGTPRGQVRFKDGGKTIATVDLKNGKARFKTKALAIGAREIVAKYRGSDDWAASASDAQTVTVDPRVGAEFPVNETTAGAQRDPALAALASGGFSVIWQGPDQDGTGIFGQRFNANAKRRGAEFQVNSDTDHAQSMPAAAGFADGGFVATWTSDTGDGGGADVFGQRFSGTGKPRGDAVRVDGSTAFGQGAPVVAALNTGGHVLLWSVDAQESRSLSLEGGATGIFGRRFGADGKPAGKAFQVNTAIAKDHVAPAVAPLADGGFVAAWASRGQDGSGFGVFAQRFDKKARPEGAEFRVNSETAGSQTLPAVAGLSGGGFVVTWQSRKQDGSGLGIFAQRYSASGKAKGDAFAVNTTTKRDQWQPAITPTAAGGFLIAWTSNRQDGSGQGVYGQMFDRTGGRIDTEFPINVTSRQDQWQPDLATLDSGDLIAVWTSHKQDGSKAGVFGRLLRFEQ